MPQNNLQKLTQFIARLARMDANGDAGDINSHHFFVMDGDDAISALTSTILSARELQQSGVLGALFSMSADLAVVKGHIQERLRCAVADHDIDDLKNLFETMDRIKGIDWSDIKNEAFVELCTHSHIEEHVFNYFLPRVPDINFKNPSENPVESGLTALEYKVTWFNYDANFEQISKLLEAGANPEKALTIAKQSKYAGGNPELEQLLESYIGKSVVNQAAPADKNELAAPLNDLAEGPIVRVNEEEADNDYEMQVDGSGAWIGVENVSIYIVPSTEGVNVEILPRGKEAHDPLESLYVAFADVDLDGEDEDDSRMGA